jgi:hypothetical protein
VPTIETGIEYADALLRAVREEAQAEGVHSTATAVTPALVAVDEADLHRLATRDDGSDVYYDGSIVWINGVDFAVRP